jgi:hypothetical protein
VLKKCLRGWHTDGSGKGSFRIWGFGARNVEPSGLVAGMVGVLSGYLSMFVGLIKIHLDKLGDLVCCMHDIIDMIFLLM